MDAISGFFYVFSHFFVLLVLFKNDSYVLSKNVNLKLLIDMFFYIY